MKKLLIFLGFVSTFFLMVAPAFSIILHFDIYRANGIGDEFWDTEYTMNQGDTIKIDVWLERFRGGVTSLSYTFEYDADLLEVIDVQPKSPWKYSRVESNNYFVYSENPDALSNEVDWKRMPIGKTALHTITLKSKKLGKSSIKAKKTRLQVGNTELNVKVSDAKAMIESQDIPNDNFNIVLITIDTLRADHLSCYGYKRETSPNIDIIAEQGIVFENAIAPSSWTAPSMASLFTSTYPLNHGVVDCLRGVQEVYFQDVFSDELTTLPEFLKAQGYTTFGVASNLHLSENFGFARGFDYFKCLPWLPASSVNEIVYSWESKIKQSDKYFLWLHYFDPHATYKAREPWIDNYISDTEVVQNISEASQQHEAIKAYQMLINDKQGLSNDMAALIKKNILENILENILALYDSEINYVDSHIGEAVQKLELDKNSLIIIASDHGEEFFEHDHIGHGNNLYQETIHVPLIIKLPYCSIKKRIKDYINLVDIMPSIAHILNSPPPKQTLGKSFQKDKGPFFWIKKMLLRNEKTNYTFSELNYNSILKTVITPQWKYIYNYDDDTEQLYDINSDPLEHNNLIDKEPRQGSRLKDSLLKWISNSKKYPTEWKPWPVSPEVKEKLKELGYIQ